MQCLFSEEQHRRPEELARQPCFRVTLLGLCFGPLAAWDRTDAQDSLKLAMIMLVLHDGAISSRDGMGSVLKETLFPQVDCPGLRISSGHARLFAGQ